MAVGAVVYGGVKLFKGSDDYCSVIPKTATVVVKGNAVDILKESGATLKDLIEYVGEKGNEFTDSTGVKFTRNLYAFMDGDEKQTVGVVVPLSDSELLEKYLKNKSVEVEKKEGYSVFTEMGMACAFDDDKALLLWRGFLSDSEALKARLDELMTQKKDDSFMATTLYDELTQDDECVCMIADGSKIFDFIPSGLGDQQSQKDMVKDFHFRVGVKIDDEKLTLAMESIAQTDSARDMVKKSLNTLDEIEGKFLGTGYNALLWMGTNMNGEAYNNLLDKEYPTDMNPTILGALKQILKSVNGDVVFSMERFTKENNIPQMSLYAEVNTNQVVEDILDILHKVDANADENLHKDGEMAYIYTIEDTFRPLTFYFGVKEKVLYMSTVSSKLPDDEPKDLTVKNEDDIEDSTMFIAFNLKGLMNLMKNDSKMEYNMLKSAVKNVDWLDQLTMQTDADGHVEFTLSIDEDHTFYELFTK